MKALGQIDQTATQNDLQSGGYSGLMSKEYAYNSDFDESQTPTGAKPRLRNPAAHIDQGDSEVMRKVKMTSDLDSGDLLSVLKSPERKWKRVQSLSVNTGLLEGQGLGSQKVFEPTGYNKRQGNAIGNGLGKGHRRVTTEYNIRGESFQPFGLSAVSVPAVLPNNINQEDLQNELKKWKHHNEQQSQTQGKNYVHIQTLKYKIC